MGGVVNVNRKDALKHRIKRVDVNAAYVRIVDTNDGTRDIVQHARSVVSGNLNSGKEFSLWMTSPSYVNDSWFQAVLEFGDVTAIGAMDLYPGANGNDADDGIARDWVAAPCVGVEHTRRRRRVAHDLDTVR